MLYKTLLKKLKTRLDEIERVANDEGSRISTLKNVWLIVRDTYAYTRESGQTVKDIAIDIDSPEGSLQKYVRFYRYYKKSYTTEIKGKPVAWSHYAAVLYISDKKQRNFYLREAAAKGWSSRELRRRIHNNYYENRTDASKTKAERKAVLSVKRQKLYTYSAQVLKVVDGDTFDLNIDVGFQTLMRHKVRLRGINCPELKTKKGEKAKKFVEDELRGAQEYQPVIIRTYKAGKFGRYIVDLWYMKGETKKEAILTKGRFLNQVLLDEGLAMKVE